MTTTQEETGAVSTANALKMAIEAMIKCGDRSKETGIAINACKEALAQQEQEPVADELITKLEFADYLDEIAQAIIHNNAESLNHLASKLKGY